LYIYWILLSLRYEAILVYMV